MTIYKLVPVGSGLWPVIFLPLLLLAGPPYLIGVETSEAVFPAGLLCVAIGFAIGAMAVVRFRRRIGTAVAVGLLMMFSVWLLGAGAKSEVSNGLRYGAVGEWRASELRSHLDTYDIPAAVVSTSDGSLGPEQREVAESAINAAIGEESGRAMKLAQGAAVALVALAFVGLIHDKKVKPIPDAQPRQGVSTSISLASTASPSRGTPAGWFPDPFKRFESRYWDGAAWTDHAATQGRTFADPPTP